MPGPRWRVDPPARRSTIKGVRRLDPHRTPQELQPAKVPTVLVFGVGTIAWLAVLLVLGARQILGYGSAGPWIGIGVAGVLLGVGGMLWGRTRRQPGGSPSGLPATAPETHRRSSHETGTAPSAETAAAEPAAGNPEAADPAAGPGEDREPPSHAGDPDTGATSDPGADTGATSDPGGDSEPPGPIPAPGADPEESPARPQPPSPHPPRTDTP